MSRLFMPKEYLRPTTVNETVSLLVKYKDRSRVIAGGTDLLVDKPPEVEYLVDITRLPLAYIKQDKKSIKIGALTTIRELETSVLFKKEPYRILAEAVWKFGTVLIRNVATIGGNICNALPSADIPPALVALDAEVKIVGLTGERVIPLEEFFVGIRKTALKSDELLTEIQVPSSPAHSGTAFLKIGRTSVDLATVSAAARVTLGKNGVFEDVRIVIGGGVGPTLIRSKRAEALLRGKKIEESLIEKAAQEASKELRPRPTSIRGPAPYKIEMSKVLLKRTLKKALERARGRG